MQPRIATKDGTVHLAWQADAAEPDGDSYLRGYSYASSTAPGAWTRTLLPHAGDDARVAKVGLSLALDSAGTPAVAYEMSPIRSTRRRTGLRSSPRGLAARRCG